MEKQKKNKKKRILHINILMSRIEYLWGGLVQAFNGDWRLNFLSLFQRMYLIIYIAQAHWGGGGAWKGNFCLGPGHLHGARKKEEKGKIRMVLDHKSSIIALVICNFVNIS